MTVTRTSALVLALLLAFTAAVYAPVLTHDFVNLDDEGYLHRNPVVRMGLSPEGVAWALTSIETMSNWHPLTWLSHMLDVELYDLHPAGHHLTSLLLHMSATAALFLVLRAMAGSLWPPALTAVLFAIHPLHVESVAWVAERKDVLSALFWFLALAAYRRYAGLPSPGRYLTVALCFALGLMSKPMVITLPLVLLLLDVWPLRRIASRGVLRLLLEKVPLLLLSAASGALTLAAQARGGSVLSMDTLPLPLRLSNAAVSAAGYLLKFFWPAGLASYYPLPPGGHPFKTVLVSLIALAVVSAGVARGARRRPYLAVGWLWYLTTLLPVLGIVQVGRQAMADRYTYLPLIGIFLMLSWGLSDLIATRPRLRPAIITLTLCALASCAVLAHRQVGTWKDSATLSRHALAVTRDNYVAHANLGVVLMREGRPAEAQVHLREALRISPWNYPSWINLGLLLARQGRYEEAMEAYGKALQLSPRQPDLHFNIALLFEDMGLPDKAAEHYREAVRLNPGDREARLAVKRLEEKGVPRR